jgi:hypothetical protein
MTNFTQIHAYVVPRSLYISLGITIGAFLITWLFIRPVQRAGLVSGLLLIFFFTYGHVFGLIDNATLFGLYFGRHRYFLPVWGLMALIGTLLILRSKSDLKKATRITNIIALIMTAIVLIQIGIKAIDSFPYEKVYETHHASVKSALISTSTKRDVYYILLDGYGRSDLLLKDLNFNNQDFIDALEERGFIIPECGQSNYIDTAYSMASTLNMNYLDDLGFSYEYLATHDHEKMLTPVITESQVRQKFRSLGYSFITFKSPYTFIDMPDSDVYLDVDSAIDPGEKIESLNFQQLFIHTTFARTAAEWLEENPEESRKVPAFLVRLVSPGSLNPDSSTFAGRNYKQYRENLFQLDSLETIPDIPGEKFIYAHLLVTHQPFTFRPSGELRLNDKDSFNAYVDQITYVNTRLTQIIDTILEKSSTPPVIILQSDHSFSDGAKRALNFQAYYFPEEPGLTINDSFSNVNTFRLVFNTYFNEELPLLPDRSMQLDAGYGNSVESIPSSCSEYGSDK